jgi:hypothetical protein
MKTVELFSIIVFRWIKFSCLILLVINLVACRNRGLEARLKNDDAQKRETIEILNLIGAKSPHLPQGSTGYCAGACHEGGSWHSFTRTNVEMIREWAQHTKLTANCLTANLNDPQKKFGCFLQDPSQPHLGYNFAKLGFFRGAAHLDFIKEIFLDERLPRGVGGVDEYQSWLEGASMPVQANPGREPSPYPLMSKDDAKRIVRWSEADAPHLEAAFGEQPAVVDPPGTSCQTKISEELRQKISSIKATKKNWAEVNKQNPNIKMLGCAPGVSSPEECFLDLVNSKKFPDVKTLSEISSWSAAAVEGRPDLGTSDVRIPPVQTMRILQKLPFRSTFWARSSADGRFFAAGLREQARMTATGGSQIHYVPNSSNGFIVDLALPSRPYIGVSAPYDPGFFPDNNGFTWMVDGSGWFCAQKILENPALKFVSLRDQPSFCSSRSMGVYQHVGRSINDKYYVIRSDNYANDDGGSTGYLTDPSVDGFASRNSRAELFSMVEQGTSFSINNPVYINTPFEGDFGISPGANFITTRVASEDTMNGSHRQVGYRIRSLDPSRAESRILGTLCMQGGKVSMSFDERFVVTHHYVNAKDFSDLNLPKESSEFQKRVRNSSNVYIFDLLTGHKYRVTFMGPRQFALYPHFRSDGWLYFLVRDMNNSTGEYAVATDVALQIAKSAPGGIAQ